MLTPTFHGTATAAGGIDLAETERSTRRDYLRSLAGQRVDIVITKHRNRRSEEANAYYWGVVLKLMAAHTEHSPEEIHDAMCEQFLPNERKRVEFFNRMTGEVLTVNTDHRRSSKLHGAPFYDFVELVRMWARDFLGVDTPDPDPNYWRKRQEKRTRAA